MASDIYKNKFSFLKTKVQDQFYYHPEDKRKNTDIDIYSKIRELFASNDFIYKINCIIDYKDGSYSKETIVAKKDNYLLTLDNKKIYIHDIYDINKDH